MSVSKENFNTFYPNRSAERRSDKPNPKKVAVRRRIEWLLEQQRAKAAGGF